MEDKRLSIPRVSEMMEDKPLLIIGVSEKSMFLSRKKVSRSAYSATRPRNGAGAGECNVRLFRGAPFAA